MTKEEAENLKPGDVIFVIFGGSSHNRILTKVWLVKDELYWNEEKYDKNIDCHLPFNQLQLVKKTEAVVIDNYLIY